MTTTIRGVQAVFAALLISTGIIGAVQASRKSGLSQGPMPRSVLEPQEAREYQDDKPIKLTTDLVTVLTSVSDPAGNLVSDLDRSDFEVYEDSVQQEIAGLYREERQALRLVLLFDTSGSIRSRFDFEKRAAARFVRKILRPGDEAAIIRVSTDPMLEIGFTSNQDELVGTLERLQVGGATALYSSLLAAAEYLRPAPGRHVIVVLSDGSDTASATSIRQALAEVQRSDAVIYSVHSTGVAPTANAQDLAGEVALKAMSEDTGGRAFFPPARKDVKKESEDLDGIYTRIAAEIQAQYMLTYYSRAQSRDNRFRAVKVGVKRPGLLVRARRGYYSSK